MAGASSRILNGVLSKGSFKEPTVVKASGDWARVEYEEGMSGERKHKPGYAATAVGSTLTVDSLVDEYGQLAREAAQLSERQTLYSDGLLLLRQEQ